MRILPCLTLLVLAACSQEAPSQPPHASSTERPSSERPPAERQFVAPLADVAGLEGEWRVAGIDGQSLDQPVGIALSASATEIWWEPRCAGMARSYAIDGQRFTALPILPDGPAPTPGAPPPPVCAIGLPTGLAEVFRAIEDADTIGRTPQNGIAISGPDHSLVLFSQ
ncbi:MAG TPA: hypothetical protein VLA45_01330 [Paracoccaceae bacterium]|nr:hypothetical protein [Paracoccaceae bacterium]